MKKRYVGDREVVIIARFDHSVLVKYVDTGLESSVSPSIIKTYKTKKK
jgi:hypothetical protein